ncbi:hypothetical protein ACFY2W_25945 [Streptomyces sp. NPDC001262]|uniref:hypothetical protein n=1 Tax=Streptomyces sp. NPDC001262 TaxID=3364552 RepID=UPI00368D02C6
MTYMPLPRDESSRAVANLKNCHCTVHVVADGIARRIKIEAPVVAGARVTAKVVASGAWVVAAEVGTVYPGGLEAKACTTWPGPPPRSPHAADPGYDGALQTA